MADVRMHGRWDRRANRRPRSLSLPTGARVFEPGRSEHKIYVLESGQVQLWRGVDAIVAHLNPGDVFGEQSLSGQPRSDRTAKVVSPAAVVALDKPDLFDLLRRDPRFARRLLRSFARRIDRYEETIRDFVVEDSERRLARLLWRLLPARPASGWVSPEFRLTNADLARMIGATRWRISHFLNRFRSLGWLRREQGLSIHREGLRQFLQPQENRKPGTTTGS